MKKLVLVFAFVATLGILIFADASVQDIIITPTQPSTLTIKVWTDRSVGSTYYPGDSIYVYFKTSQDAYVTIYDYTTSGQLKVIFPNFFQRDNFVRGGVTYVIPNPNYNYNFIVAGPNGREIIEAIASTNPNVLPKPSNSGNQLFQEIPEGRGYLQKLKLEIVGKPVAVDTTYFYVGYVPNVGTVHFDSQPQGASLYVDGVYEGVTPLDLQLAEGSHLGVFWYGQMNVSKVFNVVANTYQVVSAIIAQPQQPYYPQNQTFTINFNTTPSGAMIFVNGKMLGISSCGIDLSSGVYQITIVKPDYSTIVTEISVNHAQIFSFSLNKLNF